MSLNGAANAADPYGTDVYAVSLDPSGVLTSGQWLLTYQLFMESGYGGNANMYISQVAMDGTGAGFADGLWLNPTIADGFRTQIPNVTTGPAMVVDAWAEVRLEINLDADQVTGYYNNIQFYNGQWDIAATGTPGIGGVNFWADGADNSAATGTYYVDDFSLTQVPEPAAMGLLSLGALLTLKRRRRAS